MLLLQHRLRLERVVDALAQQPLERGLEYSGGVGARQRDGVGGRAQEFLAHLVHAVHVDALGGDGRQRAEVQRVEPQQNKLVGRTAAQPRERARPEGGQDQAMRSYFVHAEKGGDEVAHLHRQSLLRAELRVSAERQPLVGGELERAVEKLALVGHNEPAELVVLRPVPIVDRHPRMLPILIHCIPGVNITFLNPL